MSSFLNNIFASVGKAIVGAAQITAKAESLQATAAEDLALIGNGIADYEAGKPVVLGKMSENGKSGKIIAVLDGGAAAKSLEI